jgi:hypothetical protein
VARELQEHWTESFSEGLRTGLSETDAAAEASKRLGSAEDLAEEFSTRMQRSTWLARNPTLGFSALGLVLTILWWICLGAVAAEINGLFEWDRKVPGSIQPNIDRFSAFVDWIRTASYVVVPWLCCHIAERFHAGWRAALWACLIVAIHNGAHFLNVSGGPGDGHIEWGYHLSMAGPALLPIFAPLIVFAIWRLCDFREQKPHHDSPKLC